MKEVLPASKKPLSYSAKRMRGSDFNACDSERRNEAQP